MARVGFKLTTSRLRDEHSTTELKILKHNGMLGHYMIYLVKCLGPDTLT